MMILTIKDREVFEAIAGGRKRFEGRRWKEEFEKLKPGDLILFLLEGEPELVVAKVREVRPFPSVEEMVLSLWKELLPDARDPSEALSYYGRFYSLSDPAVAIGIEPLSREFLDERSRRKWAGRDCWGD